MGRSSRAANGPCDEEAPTVIFDLAAMRAEHEERDTAVHAVPVRPVARPRVVEAHVPTTLEPPPGAATQRKTNRGTTALFVIGGLMTACLLGAGLFAMRASQRLDERIRAFENLERETRAALDAEQRALAAAQSAVPTVPAVQAEEPAPSATVEPPPAQENVAVFSPGAGVWARSQVAVGAEVEQGSVIGFRLSARDYHTLVEARRVYETVQANAKRDALSKMFLGKARNSLTATERRLAFEPILAPASGTVVAIYANAGDDLAKLVTVASVRPLPSSKADAHGDAQDVAAR